MHTAHDVICKKEARKRCCWNCDLIGLLPTNHIIAYITMAYRSLWGNVRCYSKLAQTTQIIWNFIVRKLNLQEMANFGDYPGDFRLESGDRKKRFKIWSLDYPGELTALNVPSFNTFLSSSTKNKYRYTLLLTNFYIHLLGIFYCFLTFYINLHV